MWSGLLSRAVASVGLVCALALWAPPVLAIQLTVPENGAIVRPGATMTIRIEVPQGLPVKKVTYTLLEEERVPEDRVDEPVTAVGTSPPFDAAMTIPLEAVGGMRLLAVAEVAERRGTYVLFDEVSVRIQPDAALVSLRMENPVRFTKTIGEVKMLSVQGVYADRIVRDLTSGLTGTVYRSSDEKVVRVNPDGRAQAMGNGTAQITAKNGDKEEKTRVVVEVEVPDNLPPVAHAGTDQTVRQGTRVRLDAIRSADPEGENPFYYWSQVKGMPINLVEPLSLRPYFTAPVVIAPRLLRFRLIVRDKQGAESFPAYVNVMVTP